MYNDQYPSRQEMKKAHRAADAIGLDYDSHTLKPLVVEFLKNKKTVARYDVEKEEIKPCQKNPQKNYGK